MKIITILTAAALGLTATASLAQTSVIVSYADLDMTTPEGKASIARRVDRAAADVCEMSHGNVDLATRTAQRACHTQAKANAMTHLEQKLAPVYAAR